MWELLYNQEDDNWFVSEFCRNCLRDSQALLFCFLEEAEREAQRRNSPPSNGHFWSDGDDRE